MEVLAELLWTILQQHPTLLPVVVPRIVQMLLFPVSGKYMEEGGESQIVIMEKGSQKVIMNKGPQKVILEKGPQIVIMEKGSQIFIMNKGSQRRG